jgi:hypothetical protein
MNHGSHDADAPQISGGLVLLDQRSERGMAARTKPLASFVTHLLACHGHEPAYRARRRAEPRVALDSYGGSGPWPPVGRRFERVL